ncbi:hypothetical protein BAUCODRAFT_235042 [Baudoinia panamericana UAMH 10762]|uniref:Uncharacterized protein n=1 Tax=Baudoinia panamericana (strain UAMH 10762) TaxID=717646 RepID=M2N2S5_BAUPA|nr:uncharacterized protein BAUCODRAFT_235042 [Baudoinia panamericana UAMH 10762]EMC93279.1 hypothetical protein BAUCODRAFT_235042 [Baudoinia panamericana UAMH 10762]
MRPFTSTAFGLLATAASVQASQYTIINHCPWSIWITLANQGGTGNPAELQANHTSPAVTMTGSGNSVGITRDSNYWGLTEYKLIFGYTESAGTIWWSVNDVNGDPFAENPWNITSSGSRDDVCGHASNYGTNVYSCPDQAVSIFVHLCDTA